MITWFAVQLLPNSEASWRVKMRGMMSNGMSRSVAGWLFLFGGEIGEDRI
jgi:hypothetical protein